ncbi:hypothetical protein AB0I28_00850 [Phytomonospora sp. NPDC050363]|uniref:hypothetical protein n=1 Tax=Phytomonospora sp. NPDC050363 TaxID=3155642 RepID=UPI003409ED73
MTFTVRPLRDRDELRRVLATTLDRLGPGFDFRLVGTGAALLQGVGLAAGDIDMLVTERADVDRLAAALSDYACLQAPVWLPEARQYFASYAVDGVEVSISTVEWDPPESDTFECVGAGPWRHHVRVDCGGHAVAAVALELRLVAEIVRDRPDRLEAIVAHMRAHGADLDLAARALTDGGVPPERREEVLRALRG